MKQTILFTAIIAFIVVGCSGKKAETSQQSANTEPINIIFDTDMGNDVDDALALDMLYKYIEAGRVNLLAIPTTKVSQYCAEYVDVMNTWYGHPDIPVGTVVNGTSIDNEDNFVRAVCQMQENGKPEFERTVKDYDSYPKSVALYRKVLAAQPDASVYVVSVGFSTNLAQLLDSPADEYSPLTGKELVKKKVVLLSAMLGHFTDQNFQEFNVKCDIPAVQRVMKEWPTPIVASPYELGDAILYPSKSIETDFNWGMVNPLVEGYKAYLPMPYDRQTWDLTSLLYVVEKDKGYFGSSGPGKIEIDDNAISRFVPDAEGMHSYLTVTTEQAEVVKKYFIELITQKPAKYRTK